MHDHTLATARRILADLMGTPATIERIARRHRVTPHYVAGIFDGWFRTDLAYKSLDDPCNDPDLEYFGGAVRGEQLANEHTEEDEPPVILPFPQPGHGGRPSAA